MTKKRFGVYFGVTLSLIGCSSTPEDELGVARQALTQALPFRIRGVDFNAFHDSDNVHQGNCGTGPVDAEVTTDPNGGGCNIDYTVAGEWLEYSILVPTAAKFTIVSRVAASATGKTFRISVDGVVIGGSQSAPSSGLQAFADRTVKDVSLTQGTHTLRVSFDTGGTNLNYIDVTPATAPLPARIQAEDYQRAFESTPASNSGNACNRGDGVDKSVTVDSSGGCDIVATAAGEWLEYDLNVPLSGRFDFTARLASANSGRTLQINVDGNSIGTLSVPNLGPTKFDDRTLESVALSAGPHVMRVLFVQGDTSLNYLDVQAPVVSTGSGGYVFGAAADFNAFVFQDLSVAPNVTGPIAAGRDVSGLNFVYNASAAGSLGVVAARNVSASNGSVYRDLVYGNTLSLTNVNLLQGVSRKAAPIDFVATKATLSTLAADLSALPALGTTTIDSASGSAVFAASNALRNVFTVDGTVLNSLHQLSFFVPPRSTAIVNVTGSSATLLNAGIQLASLTPNRLLWNFPQATTVGITQASFKGTLLAVNAAVTTSSASVDGTVIAGSLKGQNTGVTWLPFLGSLWPDVEDCVARVRVRTDLTGKARDRAYQKDIATFCSMAGAPACEVDITSRANVDYTAAATAMIADTLTPPQYLALVRSISRKRRHAANDPTFANALCTGLDGDGDGVPDSRDACPNTPPLTATTDNGCTDSNLPAAPSAADLHKFFAANNMLINPACKSFFPIPRLPAGAFYKPADPAKGVFILSGRAPQQPKNCPLWYFFDIQETHGSAPIRNYRVAFKEAEQSTALVGSSKPVPAAYIQFNPLPTSPTTQGQLGQAGGTGVRFRVQAMNGAGVKSGWSEWKLTTNADCTALGFTCK